MEGKKKILVIEDDPELAEMIRSFLEMSNYTVTILLEGSGAVEHIVAERPDLIIVDVMLPDIDGISICREIKYHPEDKINQTPIIVLTGLSNKIIPDEAFAFGATEFLTKPFEIEELKNKIDGLLNKNKLKHMAR